LTPILSSSSIQSAQDSRTVIHVDSDEERNCWHGRAHRPRQSTLVEALTGTHPDRLAEEKRRGITIDLGFAFLEENAVRFGFVDVPGHERFVSNMLAGAAGIDVLLLVDCDGRIHQAADPRALRYLPSAGSEARSGGAHEERHGGQRTLELVRLEAEEFLRGSFLEHAPIVPVTTNNPSEPIIGSRKISRCIIRQPRFCEGSARSLQLPMIALR